MSSTAIAWHRFGLGARADDTPPDDPKRWLHDQFERYDPRPAAIAAQPGVTEAASGVIAYLADRPGVPRTAREAHRAARRAKRQTANAAASDLYRNAVGARVEAAIATDTPFVERLVHFWANHFAVSADKLITNGLVGAFEFEAIRPHVLGRFSDMLKAVERHPTMLVYLDQAQAVGPDSVIGKRIAARGRRQGGLNENLAREIFELHTMGVGSGYAQADVTEFARALTGWTVPGMVTGPVGRLAAASGNRGAFAFVAEMHQPGARTILGTRFAAGGEAQAVDVLDMLAAHPATARHVATKLARHFAGDVPPPALVARLEAAFVRGGGELIPVYRALIDAPEVWTAAPTKFTTPWEWSIAAFRALGLVGLPPAQVFRLQQQLGQPVWRPGSPAGYDDVAARWAGPDALVRRVEAAERLVSRAPPTIDARARAEALFPGGISQASVEAIDRAESAPQALALMLVAPEFLRR